MEAVKNIKSVVRGKTMDIKDTINLIGVQEQLLDLRIRVNVLEKLLVDQETISVDKYNEELEKAALLVADKIKEAHTNVEKLKSIMSGLKSDSLESKSSSEDTK